MTLRLHSPLAAVRCGAVFTAAVALASCVDPTAAVPSREVASEVRPGPLASLTCSATAPGPSSCPGISLAFSAYTPGENFGADFQSGTGTGVSNPITITFSRTITAITITAYDPTFDGNELLAFDASGAQVDSAPIAASGIPGVNIPQTVSVSATAIQSIQLVPAPRDYVAYGGLTFTADPEPQDTCQITCPDNQQLECQGGGAIASFVPMATDGCDAGSTSCTPPSGSFFPLGPTPVSCVASGGDGNVASCQLSIEVRDTLPPEIALNPPAVLWPPDHEYRAFSVASCIQSITDRCEGVLSVEGSARITSVTSDEPDDVVGGGDGQTEDDIVITGATTVNLRAERQGAGDGRVYQVHFTVTDPSGNSTQATCPVFVPHDGSGCPARDSGVASCVGPGC